MGLLSGTVGAESIVSLIGVIDVVGLVDTVCKYRSLVGKVGIA